MLRLRTVGQGLADVALAPPSAATQCLHSASSSHIRGSSSSSGNCPARTRGVRRGSGCSGPAVGAVHAARGSAASTSGYPGPLVNRRLFGGAMLAFGAAGLGSNRQVAAAAGADDIERVSCAAGQAGGKACIQHKQHAC